MRFHPLGRLEAPLTPARRSRRAHARSRSLAAALTVAVATAGLLAPSAASAATTPQVHDTFSRTISSGWGAANLGGTWAVSGRLAVRWGAGQQIMPTPGSTGQAVLEGHASTSTDLRVRTSLDKAPQGGPTYLSVLGRRVGTSGDYRARLRIQPTGAVTLLLARGETHLAAHELPISYRNATSVNVRLQVVGTSPTTLRAKAWKAGSAEPTAWQVTASDSTPALQQPGGPALTSYVSQSATNLPVTARWDDLTVVPSTTNVAPVARAQVQADGLGLRLDGSSSTDADGTVSRWSWDLGDGRTATGPTASHTYTASGTYPVVLTVTDNEGATSTTSTSVTVVAPNAAPTARLAATTSDLAVALDGSASSDPDGTLTAHRWDLGDGTSAVGATAAHTYAAAGTYTVRLTVTDDRGATASTQQAVTVTAPAPTPVAAPAPAPAPAVVKPDASNTGVRPGSTLRKHVGDIVVTTPGTVLENLDVYGFVTVKAADVTIRNSRVRGSGKGSFNTGLINANDYRVKNLVVEDVTLVPDYPSYWINGMLGHDYTARRVNTWNVVDGFGIYNVHGTAANVRVESSYVHDLAYFSPDPNHSDNKTHNDAIQIQGGSNVQIVNNTLSAWLSKTAGTQNYQYPQAGFGIILTPNVNKVTGSVIEGNWLDGSYIPIKLVHNSKTGAFDFGRVDRNRFARDMRNVPMAGQNNWFTILATPSVAFSATGNVYADNGAPVTVRRDSGTGTAP